ncbi:uncharacterized protein PHALS_10996 [Plasmopara halstedii]|uniref:Uncharacterized protein n=1 Tax=Plasmopara halstedii TaxID=4781 RepID=A0A0P1AIZ6_PLAHL|nr:uncharacterized protein PHALS_10996 [Plasmopara halstedii]CEG40816.1 hypothetical protein PHALS_10996 [Plasmopara halstedii]|eukprot:XP_024577185.1 hypothetical protein PHALS_10996 [Plasmopara halstedii]
MSNIIPIGHGITAKATIKYDHILNPGPSQINIYAVKPYKLPSLRLKKLQFPIPRLSVSI